MANASLEAVCAVADKLSQVNVGHVFVGGAIVELLLDHPHLTPIRPTDDVDVVIENFSHPLYAEIEEKLRNAGFCHDTSEGAPMCRWILNGIIVDIMPAEGGFMGLNTKWFKEALKTCADIEVLGIKIPVISSAAFLASKYAAFQNRGKRDYYASHDLEDFLTVIDGRENIASEIKSSERHLRQYIIEAVQSLINKPDFNDALSGHLPADSASQQRVPLLKKKLETIGSL